MIEFKDVAFQYEQGSSKGKIENINLTIHDGEVVLICGESGCGKTTLTKMILRLLAPMVPFLYTDIVTDGCLKGLGQMMASMAFNIAEAALGLVLVWALLPRWALTGYLVTLYICEVFNFTLSLLRLRQIINGDGSH